MWEDIYKVKNLRIHIKSLRDKVKAYKCDLCKKSFGQKAKKIIQEKTTLECQTCKKRFGEKGNLKRQVKTVKLSMLMTVNELMAKILHASLLLSII